MDAVEPGRACGSDTSHLALFGYDPRETYRGRGAFESLGAGCSMAAGDVAFKSNLATIDDATGVVTARRVDRSFEEEGPALCTHLNGALPQQRCPAHTCVATSAPTAAAILCRNRLVAHAGVPRRDSNAWSDVHSARCA